jgi:hypothetical protein
LLHLAKREREREREMRGELRENGEGENYLCERANFGERRRKRESSEVQ